LAAGKAVASYKIMPDIFIQYDNRYGERGIGWGTAIVLSAGFHVGVFILFYWILPALMAILPLWLGGEEKVDERDVVMVQLMEEVPAPPPEEPKPREFVQEPLESPPPPEKDVVNEVLPPEEKAPPPPPEIARTETPPPTVKPPKVEESKPETPRPNPPRTAETRDSGPKPISGLSEAAASRLLGRSLGYDSGEVAPSSSGLRRDEEMTRYRTVIRNKIRTVIRNKIRPSWAPVGRAMSAQKEARFELKIESNGRVSRSRMTQSSGNRDFDQSVERALKKASPFPPLPSAFGGQAAILDLSLSPEQMR